MAIGSCCCMPAQCSHACCAGSPCCCSPPLGGHICCGWGPGSCCRTCRSNKELWMHVCVAAGPAAAGSGAAAHHSTLSGGAFTPRGSLRHFLQLGLSHWTHTSSMSVGGAMGRPNSGSLPVAVLAPPTACPPEPAAAFLPLMAPLDAMISTQWSRYEHVCPRWCRAWQCRFGWSFAGALEGKFEC